MTLNQAITKVREFSRTHTTAASDTQIMQLLNEGQREFAKDVYGFVKEEYLTITPVFDIQTDFAISVALNGGTATDVCITATDFIDVTAGAVATQLVTALTAQAATCTISWATASWYFTVTFGASVTSVVLGSPTAPTHIDAIGLIMGGGASYTAPTCTGSYPEDCAIEASLPADFLWMYNVEWDDNKLSQAPHDIFISPEQSGTPQHYVVRNKRLRLFPVPTSQKKLHILYKYYPTDWVDAATQSSATLSIDTEYQMAPVYYAAALMSDINYENERSMKYNARYRDQVLKYNIQWNNQNPQMFPKSEPFVVPKVTFASTI